MKNLLPVFLIAAAFAVTASAAAAQGKTSMDYLRESSAHYMNGDHERAIPPYQKALDLEKKERKLERTFWILLVDNLVMAYGITGDI